MYPKMFFFTSGGGESSDSNFKMARYYWKLKVSLRKRRWFRELVGLSRGDVGRDVRHRNQQLLADVRPRIPGSSHPFSIPLPLPDSWGSQPGTAANEWNRPYSGRSWNSACSGEPVQEPVGSSFPKMITFRESGNLISMRSCSWRMKSSPVSKNRNLVPIQHWGIEPDMIQFAKAITSGYFPLGGIQDQRRNSPDNDGQWNPMDARLHLQFHHVGCAFLLAMDLIEQEDFPPKPRKKEPDCWKTSKWKITQMLVTSEGLEWCAGSKSSKTKPPAKNSIPPKKSVPRSTRPIERGLFSRVGEMYTVLLLRSSPPNHNSIKSSKS